MNLQIKNNQKGFTIVELLIVIVVIAILAAITIVAFNGIQNRAKATSGQNLASQIAKKAEIYNTAESTYPTFTQLTTNTGAGTAGNPAEAKLDDATMVRRTGVGVVSPFGGNAYTTTVSNGNATVAYSNCSGGAPITGGVVLYYNYTTSPATTIAKYVGTGAAGCLGTVGGP